MSKKSKKQKRNKKLMCHHCNHIWTYTGASELYVTCPICHYKVMVSKGRKLFLANQKIQQGNIHKKKTGKRSAQQKANKKSSRKKGKKSR